MVVNFMRLREFSSRFNHLCIDNKTDFPVNLRSSSSLDNTKKSLDNYFREMSRKGSCIMMQESDKMIATVSSSFWQSVSDIYMWNTWNSILCLTYFLTHICTFSLTWVHTSSTYASIFMYVCDIYLTEIKLLTSHS